MTKRKDRTKVVVRDRGIEVVAERQQIIGKLSKEIIRRELWRRKPTSDSCKHSKETMCPGSRIVLQLEKLFRKLRRTEETSSSCVKLFQS